MLTLISKLMEASWSEATDSPVPGTAQAWHTCIEVFCHTQNSEMMFGILEGSDFLVTIKKQGSQYKTVKLHKNMWKVLFLT